jgi:hypothetical protein
MAPSSPKRPCSARKATSSFAARSTWSMSRPTTIGTTSWPLARSACTTASPDRIDTPRSAEIPPNNTPTRVMAPLLFLRDRRPTSCRTLDELQSSPRASQWEFARATPNAAPRARQTW